MDKKVLKQIRQFATMLPIVTSECKKKVLGSEILKTNTEAKDGSGNPVDAGKVYEYDSTIRVNHYRAMKKVYKAEGT